ALLAYEYFITLDREINLFWKRKVTGATVLFLATRYLLLLSYNLLGMATFAPMTQKVRFLFSIHCVVLEGVQLVVALCQYPVLASFSALRALALSGMNWPLAACVFGLALVPFVLDLVRTLLLDSPSVM
ncbi:hypothetical protein OH77DRAFT_1411320, partial [Trametes cingulata]